MKRLIHVLIIGILCSCDDSGRFEPVVIPGQVATLLESYEATVSHDLEKIHREVGFWQKKLDKNPVGFLYAEKLAKLHEKRFALSGAIEDIDSSNQYLKKAISLRKNWKVNGLQHAYIGNLMKLHQFKRAERLCLELTTKNPRDLGYQLLLFDALMELGDYEEAQRLILKVSKSNKGFDVIVRQAKFFDYLGNLERTIELMTRADSMAMKSTNPSLQAWTKTILGEYLTHSGAIKKGYEQFIQAVRLDPTQEYAWLNIAWIAYSNDDNSVLYEHVLSNLNIKSSPDLLWDLAQLYNELGDQRYDSKIRDFFKAASETKYRGWYERKLAQVESEYFKNHKKACMMAKKQVEQRPTLESYDLLSWSLFQAGELDSAKAVFEKHLFQKTSEPLIQYHGGEIYLKSGHYHKAGQLLAQAAESRFELGPKIYERIEDLGQLMP